MSSTATTLVDNFPDVWWKGRADDDIIIDDDTRGNNCIIITRRRRRRRENYGVAHLVGEGGGGGGTSTPPRPRWLDPARGVPSTTRQPQSATGAVRASPSPSRRGRRRDPRFCRGGVGGVAESTVRSASHTTGRSPSSSSPPPHVTRTVTARRRQRQRQRSCGSCNRKPVGAGPGVSFFRRSFCCYTVPLFNRNTAMMAYMRPPKLRAS
jgi:hypothetical protein